MNISDVKTDPKLLEALRQSHRPLTQDELFEQRVSFIAGSVDIPKSEIRRILGDAP